MADNPDTKLPSDQAERRVANTQGGDTIEVGDISNSVGVAIGHGASATVTVVYQWARTQPADPQTIAAAQSLLAQLPTDALPDHAALPPGSRMPFARNPLFVGRTADLRALARALKPGGTAAIGQTAAATGLGGIGKTNLATEFVHRYGPFFAGGVFWLSFAEPANIPLEIAACGGEGGLQLRPDFASLPLDAQVAAVQHAWTGPLPRLLIFDNCDSDAAEALVQQYRPTTGGCRVLLTSRRVQWDAALGVTTLPLQVFRG